MNKRLRWLGVALCTPITLLIVGLSAVGMYRVWASEYGPLLIGLVVLLFAGMVGVLLVDRHPTYKD